jgi:hypothetical protein
MNIEESIKNAYRESANNTRTGDTTAELDAIRTVIRNSKSIVVPNRNGVKITVINEVLKEFGLTQATHLQCDTYSSDLSRMPAVTKATMALDVSESDLVIARGRLGVPGSGSMLVVMDAKGRILTAGFSPSHVIHGKPVADAVRDEMRMALERIGFSLPGRGEDDRERT